MEISSNKVLGKIEELVGQAKAAITIDEKVRYITAIKALCELMVDEQPIMDLQRAEQVLPSNSKEKEPVSSKPMVVDQANGSSLFDF